MIYGLLLLLQGDTLLSLTRRGDADVCKIFLQKVIFDDRLWVHHP